MKKGAYYYILASLPELTINDKETAFTPLSFRETWFTDLAPRDRELLEVLYFEYDMQNICRIILEEADTVHDERGSLTEEDLRNGLVRPEQLPAFLGDFIVDTSQEREGMNRKTLINLMYRYFMEWTGGLTNEFLHQWLRMDHDLRNIGVAVNCLNYGLARENEVVGDDIIAEQLVVSKEKDFDLHRIFPGIEEVLTFLQEKDIAARESALDEFRWRFLDEEDQKYFFGIENILVYVAKLKLIERRLHTSRKKGQDRLDGILGAIRGEFKLPQELI